MSSGRSGPPARVPTLTEVVRMPDAAAVLPEEAPAAEPSRPAAAGAAGTVATGPAFVERRAAWPPLDEEQIVERVLDDVQRQIDLMLEVRLREVLAPIVTRATDTMLREARNELASTLRDVVSRAVAQELSRHRGR